MSGADLYKTNFRGADLQDANFSNADLYQADLRESNLQGADLSAAKGGLLSNQLAGCDLTGAKLPEPLAKLYGELSAVKEISSNAQKLFLALLAGCLYSWLTIAQTTDVELITNRATSPLPIIQAAIPIVGFYVVGPLILLCLYFYFHFYLQKLWEELGSLPAVFTDSRELHKRTDPWLLNDLVRSNFAKLKDGRPFLSHFQAWVSILLAWWLVPITLFAFWLRFIRRHDLFWTVVHALLLALAIYSGVRLYTIAKGTLRGEERIVFYWKTLLKRGSTYGRFGFITALSALLIVISAGTISGEPYWEHDESHMQFIIASPRSWMPSLMARSGYYPFANLKSVDISAKPANWTDRMRNQEEELQLVKGANLSGSDLRNADAQGAFFVKSNLGRAHLEGASFQGANLQDANFEGTCLEGSNFEDANLSGADLSFTSMFWADFRSALLPKVKMNYAELPSAFLEEADLKDSSIDYAYLADAHLDMAHLDRASLMGADLDHASFIDAQMDRTDLAQANLAYVVFYEANLANSCLTGANLTGADLREADLRHADFRSSLICEHSNFLAPRSTTGLTLEMITKARNWQFAFYDPDMLEQLGLPADHNEKLQEQMEKDKEFAEEAKKHDFGMRPAYLGCWARDKRALGTFTVNVRK